MTDIIDYKLSKHAAKHAANIQNTQEDSHEIQNQGAAVAGLRVLMW
jgi:hypothetical protein